MFAPCSRLAMLSANCLFAIVCFASGASDIRAQQPDVADVERQPLVANLNRLTEALNYLGYPLPAETRGLLQSGISGDDSPVELQEIIDREVLFSVSINPELRVKVQRGPGKAVIQQAGYTPVIIKVLNAATVARAIRMSSPQAGPVYGGAAPLILARQAQTELLENENAKQERRFLDLEMFEGAQMSSRLSGLGVEYLIGLIYSSEAGQREATIVFDVGQGTQDLGFRSQVPVLFNVRPAIPVRVQVRDHDGTATTARLEIQDEDGRIYPPQAKRLAPDFFFQPQVYRRDGDTILLPPGRFRVRSSRGPEYLEQEQELVVQSERSNSLAVDLERWVTPSEYGFYCGDHHIHGAGCSHYDNPTLGVTPADMFSQVQGEGLHVGCILTWGPCFEHQRNYFSPLADQTSEPLTVLKYDLEISGFGSAALGHVCLLNLSQQTYPGSEGTKIKGWPSWTVPVMRWTKEQGGFTGYPHSALHVNPQTAAGWILREHDTDQNGTLNREESNHCLLPDKFTAIDLDGNLSLDLGELTVASDRAADVLPNLALPAMDGGGAMEIFVSTAEGVCDFISAMDTARIPEWNTWYHLMNCGFPLKLSGETDFPCMSSRRVGQGRVYVQLGPQTELDFGEWCRQLARGNSYVSDGFAHALEFSVNKQDLDTGLVEIAAPAMITVNATVAFAERQPRAVAYGTLDPAQGPRMAGDTVNLHAPRDTGYVEGGERLVELIINGQVAQSQKVPADGKEHELKFDVPLEESSWVAIRQFPQLHTNPIEVRVGGRPIRASRNSAIWCIESTKRLWENRARFIKPEEREDARQAYQRATELFAERAAECTSSDIPIPSLKLLEQK